MATESEELDHWRKYFRNANSDIFDVIEHAILVAATDCPKEFRTQRARIVENLFSCSLARCSGCDHVEPQVPDREDQDGELQGREDDAAKDNNINRVTNVREDAISAVTTLSYDEAKALTEEIEEECQTTREVLRIKEIIANQDDQSETELFDSLRRLQLMDLSFGTLEETGIGKAVNCLRKHRSKRIRQLMHALIDVWKVTVEEWLRTTAVIAESTPDSANSSYTVVEEEEGLPSLPLDAGAFFPIGMDIELSQIFDCMDEDGNLRISGELDENGENGRKPIPENDSKPQRKLQLANNVDLKKEGENGRKPMPENPSKPIRRLQSSPLQPSIPDNNSQMRKQDAINKQSKQQETLDKPIRRQEAFNKPIKQGEAFNKPIKQQETFNKNTTFSVTKSGSGPGRPLKPQEPALIHKKPQDNRKYSDEPEDQKLEAAKRRLHEGYLQVENAKKQRTIQIMELHDLPKQGLQRPSNPKHGFQNRRLAANGRR